MELHSSPLNYLRMRLYYWDSSGRRCGLWNWAPFARGCGPRRMVFAGRGLNRGTSRCSFPGNTSAEQYACLAEGLRTVHSLPVPIGLGDLGFFDRDGVFFAGVELTPQLISLQGRVTEATAGCGFVAEDRAFHPHITLARRKGQGTRGPGSGGQLRVLKGQAGAQPHCSRFTAREFVLYESHLGSGGSRYEIRARFPLLP